MNQFEIHDNTGEAVYIQKLDEEASTLWGTKAHNKEYASPYDKPEVLAMYPDVNTYSGKFRLAREKQNWFDRIGWMIAQGNTTWLNLKASILDPYIKAGYLTEALADPRIGGFIQLLDLWESKGYVPVSLNGNGEILFKNGVIYSTIEETRLEEAVNE